MQMDLMLCIPLVKKYNLRKETENLCTILKNQCRFALRNINFERRRKLTNVVQSTYVSYQVKKYKLRMETSLDLGEMYEYFICGRK